MFSSHYINNHSSLIEYVFENNVKQNDEDDLCSDDFGLSCVSIDDCHGLGSIRLRQCKDSKLLRHYCQWYLYQLRRSRCGFGGRFHLLSSSIIRRYFCCLCSFDSVWLYFFVCYKSLIWFHILGLLMKKESCQVICWQLDVIFLFKIHEPGFESKHTLSDTNTTTREIKTLQTQRTQ